MVPVQQINVRAILLRGILLFAGKHFRIHDKEKRADKTVKHFALFLVIDRGREYQSFPAP